MGNAALRAHRAETETSAAEKPPTSSHLTIRWRRATPTKTVSSDGSTVATNNTSNNSRTSSANSGKTLRGKKSKKARFASSSAKQEDPQQQQEQEQESPVKYIFPSNSVDSEDHSKLLKQTKAALVSDTDAARIALAWCQAFFDHNMMHIMRLTKPECIFHFEDANLEIPCRMFVDNVFAVFDSFPNLQFHWSSIKESESTPGKVVVKNWFGYGHHTGIPFEFAPHPPIPAQGHYIQDEPIKLTLIVKDGMVTKCISDGKGKVVGPPGLYAKLVKATSA